MRYTIYINIKVLLSEPHIFPNEGEKMPQPMGPCRCKLLFVIKHRWTLQFSPLANVRAKNWRLPDVAAGLNFHCLISLNLITGDMIMFLSRLCRAFLQLQFAVFVSHYVRGMGEGYERSQIFCRCLQQQRYCEKCLVFKIGWDPGSFQQISFDLLDFTILFRVSLNAWTVCFMPRCYIAGTLKNSFI